LLPDISAESNTRPQNPFSEMLMYDQLIEFAFNYILCTSHSFQTNFACLVTVSCYYR
jgi:hypothetical protein